MSLIKVGEMHLEKGQIRENIAMNAWDGIKDCDVGRCPIVDMCTYIKRGKCAVQMKYLDTLYNAILGTYRHIDEMCLFKIGMQIVPLYVQLVKLQMVELSLDSPMMANEAGNISVHPVYKEIRSTLTTIYGAWKDLNLSFNFSGKIQPNRSGNPILVGDTEKGDPNYYKSITDQNVSRKGVIR